MAHNACVSEDSSKLARDKRGEKMVLTLGVQSKVPQQAIQRRELVLSPPERWCRRGTTPSLFLRVVALATCDVERETPGKGGKGREELWE